MSAVRRVGWVALGVVAVAGIGLTAAAGAGFGFAPATSGDEQAPPVTAEVTRQDLIATTEKSGEVANTGERTLRGRGGVVTWLPAAGSVIERGGQLVRIDERPIVLLYGELPAYRALEIGATGADVQQFEENLAALGYTGFDVDTSFTWATAEAVMEWQETLGVEETGSIAPGSVHYASGPVQVSEVSAAVGDDAGGDLLGVASQSRMVTVDLEESDVRYAVVGTAVTVTLPDGSSFPAAISSAETVVIPGEEDLMGGGGDDTTVLRVTVAPDDPADLTAYGSSTAKVEFVADRRDAVLTVPVAALLALAEGGYGVEIVHDDTSTLVAVETGMFADGRVEITGDDIAEGDRVVVPE
ncbi:peptidoglycan-binding domain-containing protein [Agromyces sp. H66]|uniref:peptidoglycan-binding protein n=1 Tax=Agromyces sp. H66 TaxID=2529859 RepID=UPI001B7D7860|nr:peptidoglycan-binding domain-containing protein [Agromyces sp. H66]